MSSSSDDWKALELFNEKADQLLSSAFFEQASGGGSILEFNSESGWDSVHSGPDDESTRALVLTLRLFMQDNDRISLRNMATTYRRLQVSAPLRNEFDANRSQLDAFLDSASQLAIAEGDPLTYRQILEMFVYGEHAHLSARHRSTYEDLRKTPFFSLFQSSFVDAVVVFARCIRMMRETNCRALTESTASES